MLVLSREEKFEAIRRERRLDPQASGRTLAAKFKVSRRTVAAALASPVPPMRRKPAPRRSVLEPAMEWVDAMLREDLSAPRKQKHTAERIHHRLLTEYGFDQASYSTVCNYVRGRRLEIAAEAKEGRRHLVGTVPQQHLPGEEAEVDFAEAWVVLAGTLTKCHLFTLRLSYSGKAVHRLYVTQAQEAFLEGHAEAFSALGGVPTRHIRYDNLKPAVTQVCFGRNRIESGRWATFRAWAGFERSTACPGSKALTRRVGSNTRARRPSTNTWSPWSRWTLSASWTPALSVRLTPPRTPGSCTAKRRTVGVDFAAEAPLLNRLPDEDFDCGVTLTPLVRRDSRIVVRQCYYSVPARFIGSRVRVSLRANEVAVFDGRTVVARHPRLTRRYDFRDVLDHYLEILMVKPGALAGSTGLAAARAEGSFTPVHDGCSGCGARCARRGREVQGTDRGAAAAPPLERGCGDGRADGRVAGRVLQPGAGGDRGPQSRRPRRTRPRGSDRRTGRRLRRRADRAAGRRYRRCGGDRAGRPAPDTARHDPAPALRRRL